MMAVFFQDIFYLITGEAGDKAQDDIFYTHRMKYCGDIYTLAAGIDVRGLRPVHLTRSELLYLHYVIY